MVPFDADQARADGSLASRLRRFGLTTTIQPAAGRRALVIGLGIAALAVAARTLWVSFGPELTMNYTHSEPRGLYRVVRIGGSSVKRGDQILFPVPEPFRQLVVSRGWINEGHPFLKQVGALAGDRVCVDEHALRINDAIIGPVFDHDSLGRPLPQIRGCMTIRPGEFFPLSTYTDKSFDGRYIGPQPLSSIYAYAVPVWTF